MKTKFYTLLVIVSLVALLGTTFATHTPAYADSGMSHKRDSYSPESYNPYMPVSYPNPYDLVCFDPLMSSVVLTLAGCNLSAPIVSNNPAPTVTDETVTNDPTNDKPLLDPIPAPTKDDTESSCKNKNSGKDGTPDECNAGHGQEKKDN